MKRKLFFTFLTIMSTLSLHAQLPPVACFTGTPSGSCQIFFTDLSLNNPTTWMWNFPGGMPSTTAAQNPTITYSTPGIYDVKLIVFNAFGTDSLRKIGVVNATICYFDTITIYPCDTASGVLELKNSNYIADIFPNPFDNFISINFKDNLKGNYVFEIIDIYGRQVKSIVLYGNKQISTGDLTVGMYFYRLLSNNIILQTGRMIKE